MKFYLLTMNQIKNLTRKYEKGKVDHPNDVLYDLNFIKDNILSKVIDVTLDSVRELDEKYTQFQTMLQWLEQRQYRNDDNTNVYFINILHILEYNLNIFCQDIILDIDIVWGKITNAMNAPYLEFTELMTIRTLNECAISNPPINDRSYDDVFNAVFVYRGLLMLDNDIITFLNDPSVPKSSIERGCHNLQYVQQMIRDLNSFNRELIKNLIYKVDLKNSYRGYLFDIDDVNKYCISFRLMPDEIGNPSVIDHWQNHLVDMICASMIPTEEKIVKENFKSLHYKYTGILKYLKANDYKLLPTANKLAQLLIYNIDQLKGE